MSASSSAVLDASVTFVGVAVGRVLGHTMARVDSLMEKLFSAKKFEKVTMYREEVERVLDQTRGVLMARPMLLEVTAPLKVMGDIHGQFYDLLHIFEIIGVPSTANQFMALGDYVDRGRFGLETILLLFCLKCKYPDSVHLLRGNHEATSVSRVYGFYEETKERYDVSVWRRFMEVFDCLPVAALINGSILCMHGGLSPLLYSLDDIRNLKRPSEVPPGGLYADLLWADPDKNLEDGWCENARGVSFTFGKKQVFDTCDRLKLDLIMRAHQVVFYGYEMFADSKLITLFTAPNFCGQFENMGAVAKVEENLKITLIIVDGRKEGLRGTGGYRNPGSKRNAAPDSARSAAPGKKTIWKNLNPFDKASVFSLFRSKSSKAIPPTDG